MELNTKGRYAVMAMADIARHGQDTAVPLSQIADRQRLPLPYLEQIFLQLRRAGLVESARGRAGGYRLSRAAADVSVAAIMGAVDEETRFTRCGHSEDGGCTAGERCITHSLWQGLGDATTRYLESVSLTDVIAAASNATPAPAASATAAVKHKRVYLDYNATSPLVPEARTAMIDALDVVGNASSVHSEGRRARTIIEAAREEVAALVGAKASEVVFTSGATEAAAWALRQRFDTIYVSAVEHDCVLAAAKEATAARIVECQVSPDGRVMTETMAAGVLSASIAQTSLAVLQMANNETGIVQPIGELTAFARAHGVTVFSDAAQAAGRIPIDFAALGVDLMALSAHKMGGPKGIGALVVRDRLDLKSLISGGGQERSRRAGTENVAAIAGFGAAAAVARRGLSAQADIAARRDRLEAGIRALTPHAVFIGANGARLPNTSAIALPGLSAETLVIRFDLAGIAISAGAACSSGKVGASRVLRAMMLDADIARAAIRVSLGASTTDADIAAFLAAWKSIAGQPALAA